MSVASLRRGYLSRYGKTELLGVQELVAGAGDSVSSDEKSAMKRGNWWEELL